MSEVPGATTAVFDVHGMHCDGCVNSIKSGLQKKDGVLQVAVSLTDSSALVTYDPDRIRPEALAAAIEELGYETVQKK